MQTREKARHLSLPESPPSVPNIEKKTKVEIQHADTIKRGWNSIPIPHPFIGINSLKLDREFLKLCLPGRDSRRTMSMT
jgi:hypothetical protein